MRIILLTLFFSSSFLIYPQKVPTFAKTVFDNMFNSMSDGTVGKPKLVLSQNEKEVATYKPQNGELWISERFLNLAKSFGDDSLNVIAHVLGHELAHILIQQNSSIKSIGTGYASEEVNDQLDRLNAVLMDSAYERQADEFACFYAHIAGYKTTHIAASILDSVYRVFELKDDNLKRYPPLKERIKITEFAANQMKLMNHMFETAIFATLAGNYDIGIGLYETIISNKYSGKEILNNLGTTYLLKGIQFIDTLQFPYYFPVAIETNTNLGTTRTSILDPIDLLFEAKRNILNSLKRDEKYMPAVLNLAIVEFLLGNTENFENSLLKLGKTKDFQKEYCILKAIQLHKNGDFKKSKKVFDEVGTDRLVKLNLKKLYNVKEKNVQKSTHEFENIIAELGPPIIQPKMYLSDEAKSADTLRFALKGGEAFRRLRVESEGALSEWWIYLSLNTSFKFHELKNRNRFANINYVLGHLEYNMVYRMNNKEYWLLGNILIILGEGKLNRIVVFENN